MIFQDYPLVTEAQLGQQVPTRARRRRGTPRSYSTVGFSPKHP